MNNKANARLLVTLLLLACSAECLAQVPVSVLLDNVRESADYVASYTGFLKPGNSLSPLSDESSGFVFKRPNEGIDAVDTALAAGVPATRTVDVKFESGSKSMSFSEIRQMCQRMAGFMGGNYYRLHAAQEATNASIWPKLLASNSVDGLQAKSAVEAGKACVTAIDEALTGGITGATEINVMDRRMSITEAREMCMYVRCHPENRGPRAGRAGGAI